MEKIIMIVEDNEANRCLMRDICMFYGYEVIEAGEGAKSVSLAVLKKPDLIFMDIQMPGMNGCMAIQKLRENPETKGIKIIAVTSFAMQNDRNNIMESGADDLITKPINTRELPLIIERFIGKGR
jgi:CheY-like chemotaxis protein